MSQAATTRTPEIIAPPRRHRADQPTESSPFQGVRLTTTLVVAIITVFTLLGAGRLDLGPLEARLGMASGERIGPFGLVYGAWEPGLLPARLVPSQLWAWFYGGVTATAASVRWPEAIAAALIALVASRRVGAVLGNRAAILAALTTAGTVAMIDRSAAGLGLLDGAIAWLVYGVTGSYALMIKPIVPDLNLIAGLGAVLALDRLRSRGPDLAVGLLAGVASLAGGWPMLAVVAVPSFVLGSKEGAKPGRAVVGALAIGLAWSVWAWSTARFEAWAAAVALPLVKGPTWTLALWVLAYALPWSTLAVLPAFRSIRDGWSEEGKTFVLDWLKIVGALALAGTLIPGLGNAARVPILLGLAMASAAGLERVIGDWSSLSKGAKRTFWTATIAGTVGWAALASPIFGYVAAAIGAYRSLAIVLIGVALIAPAVALAGQTKARPILGVLAMVLVCLGLKLAHWGVIVPEWNYRASQGPWGRAIGQWMPRTATLYFINATTFNPGIPDRDRWPADLAFHTGRKVRQIPAPEALDVEPRGRSPHFVLLHPSEFERWPKTAPPIQLVRTLQDRTGEPRVLARTEGPMYPDRRKELGE
ncbi:hypothetical protein [Tautonia rosea]|uniref:hypothetical protein n=1 Tax=Tautonia rosea TaxID=2728037 RepID=UPI001475E582|nr:hypothetical protein [Tautonia rosea]